MSQIYKPGIGSGPIPPTILETLTGNTGVATAAGNNINTPGNNTADNGFATWTIGSGDDLQIKSYGAYKWIVNPIAGVGTHTTINAAVAVASAGDSIFITPGTYTENIVATKSLNLMGADMFVQNQASEGVTIIGKISNSTPNARVSITNCRLVTNGDYVAELSGSDASQMLIKDCYLQGSNFSLTSSSNSSTSSNFVIENCWGNLLTTGINIFNHSSANTLKISNCTFFNEASSTTANTSAATLILDNVSIGTPTLQSMNIQITGGNALINNCFISQSGSSLILTGGTTIVSNSTIPICTMQNNAISRISSSLLQRIDLTDVSGVVIDCCEIVSGISSGVIVGSTSTATLTNSIINSSNVNAIFGNGTISLGNVTFTNSSNNAALNQVPFVSSNDCIKVSVPSGYPYTVVPQDAFIPVDSSAARTINLPSSPRIGQKHTIKDNAGLAATNNITIVPAAGNIDGATSYIISTNYGSVDLVYNGSQWNVK